MNEDIQNWLSDGKDYYSGVMLLRQLGEETAYFDRYLSAAVAPDYQRGRLYEALMALGEQQEKPFAWLPEAGTQSIDALRFRHIHPSQVGVLVAGKGIQMNIERPSNEPLSIKALRGEAARWHKIEADNHAQMHVEVLSLREVLPLQTSNLKLQTLVIDRQTRIAPNLDAIYDKIRTYYQTGEEPTFLQLHGTPTPLSKTDKEVLNDLWREKLSIEPRLSKIKKQVKYHEEIAEKFDRLKEVNRLLGIVFDKLIADYL
jgi:hypothetical protein